MSARLLRPILMLMAMSTTGHGAQADTGIELPASIRQGELVIGRVPPGSQVRLDGRDIRVASEGWFAFGVGRDTTGPQTVVATLPDGRRTQAVVDVAPREWRIERVDGLPQSTVTPDPEIATRIAREQARVTEARKRDDDRTDFIHGFIGR